MIIISMLLKNDGIIRGYMNSNNEPEDLDLHIANLVKDGFTSGHHPYWKIEFEDGILEDDEALKAIAKLIEEGNIEGHYPQWKLTKGEKS